VLRAIRAGLKKRFEFRLPNFCAFLTAVLVNQQTSPRSQTVGPMFQQAWAS
jgi:hypothetical protein